MALQRVKLADIQYVPATAGVLLENTNGTDKVLVTGITLYNGNTTAETVELYYVPDNGAGGNGTAGAGNRFLKVSLSADETLAYDVPDGGIYLTDDGDSIQGKTTTASKVTAILHGDKIT